jgi:hypothetical protein
MTKFSLPRVFNNYHFRVVFEFRPFPFLKRDHPLADHTQVYQSIFLPRQPIGDLSLASHPGHIFCLSLFAHVYRIARGITRPLCRIHDQPNCGKRVTKSICGQLHLTAYKPNSGNLLTTAAFPMQCVQQSL